MTYQRLVCPRHGVIELASYEVAETLGDNQVLVRNTHGAEKHGTMESFVHKHGNMRGAWDADRLMHTPGEGVAWGYPIPLGNMQVGMVEKVGRGVSRYHAGDRLVFFRGFEPVSIIEETEGWKIGAETSWKSATCLDPATFAFCALRDGNVRIGDAVAIFGLGAIGLTAVELAKRSGCFPVFAIDPVAPRREVARQLGADEVIDPAAMEDVGARLREGTAWRGVDVVIEYSGALEAMQAALRGVAFGGTVVAGAFPGPLKAGLDLGAEAHMNRPQIVFSRTESDPNRDHPRWDNNRVRNTVHRLIETRQLNGDAIVGPVAPFGNDLAEVYQKTLSDRSGSVKMGVSYQ